MIRYARLTLFLIAIVLIQTTVMPYLRILDVVPELALVATIAIAYREGPETGAGFGFVAGFATDLFIDTPLGLSALVFTLTGYLIGVVQGAMARTAWWVPPVLGGLGGLVSGLLFVGIGTLVGQEQLWALRSLRIVAISACYDAVVAFIVFPVASLACHSDGPRTASPSNAQGW